MKTLTADTKIIIKRSRPALTGDTKIRLSQIKDLAAWVEDRRYGIGEISTKTGLMKTTEGWVVPPHAMAPMFNGYEEGSYKTTPAGGERYRSAKTNEEIEKEPIRIKRNISLEIEDNPNEKGWYLKQNEIIENVKSIARGKGIDDIERLVNDHPLPTGKPTKPEDWEKCKGEADAYKDGKKRRADIHWYQAKNVGKVEHKVKKWIIQIKGRK